MTSCLCEFKTETNGFFDQTFQDRRQKLIENDSQIGLNISKEQNLVLETKFKLRIVIFTL